MNLSGHVTIVAFGSDPETLACYKLLTAEGMEVVQSNSEDSAFQAALNRLPDLVIAESRLPGSDGLDLVRKLRGNPVTSQHPILMLSSRTKTSDKAAAYDAGIDDHVTKPFHPQEILARIRALLARTVPPDKSAAEPVARGRVIAIYSPKGGVGKTTVAVNLALALQSRVAKPVGLMDADFFFSNVAVQLDLPTNRTFVDFVSHLGEMDDQLADHIIARHSSGIRVLLGPTHPAQAELIAPEDATRALDYMSRLFPFVVVDCQPSYDERILSILERADQILLVVTPEIGPFRNISIFLDMANSLGISTDKIRIVLNRSDSQVGVEEQQIQQALGMQVSYRIASGGRPVVISTNNGTPMVLGKPNHPFSKQVIQIAESLCKTNRVMATSPGQGKTRLDFSFKLEGVPRASETVS